MQPIHLGLLSLAMALSGCAGLGTPPPRVTTFDLGAAVEAVAASAPATLDVQAPSWLSSSEMQYRRDDRIPSARESYAFSRWAGVLPELLAHRIDVSLAGAPVRLHCRLRIDLDEAIQIFDSTTQSRVEWQIRLSLMPLRDASPVAQKRLVAVVDAETADADGGVRAHREAVNTLVGQIRKWLDEIPSDPTAHRTCRKSA